MDSDPWKGFASPMKNPPSAGRIARPPAFADSLATFKMLPVQGINIVALGLPPFEILLGLMLISGWQAQAGSLAVVGIAIVFGIALGQALVRGLVVDCGCFGSGGVPSTLETWSSFCRAFLLLAGSLWLYRVSLTADSSRTESEWGGRCGNFHVA